MGPKRSETSNRSRILSQSTLGVSIEHVNQQFSGKFAVDLESCCRDPSLPYPVNIPVFIRGHCRPIPTPAPVPAPTPVAPAPSATSATPSLANGVSEEQITAPTKRSSRTRTSSASQSVVLPPINPIEVDNRSVSTAVQEPAKPIVPLYKTFNVIRESEFYRPKLLVDSMNNEHEPIEQIQALYMKGWLLDLRFIDILKKILPSQEHLNMINFSYVGLNGKTLTGLIDLLQSIKNLKTVILDGNPLVGDYSHMLLQKEDSKIAHLSLRFCEITDSSAERISNLLGNLNTQNRKLLTLILSGNKIGDNGAKSFATALRYNRTLLSLNLSSNLITDKGASALAQVLREFVLNEEETIKRRFLLSKIQPEISHNDSKHRNVSPTPSNASITSKAPKETKSHSESNRRKSARLNKEKNSGRDPNDDSRSNKIEQKKTKNENVQVRRNSLSNRRSLIDGPKSTGQTKEKRSPSNSNKKSSHSNLHVGKEKEKEKEKENDHEKTIHDSNSINANENPLMNLKEKKNKNGEILLPGNFVLLSLNLSRNFLSLKSVEEFVRSVEFQSSFVEKDQPKKSTNEILLEFSGLCRLELKGMNKTLSDSALLRTLEEFLLQKNPSFRFQQFREREMKIAAEQSQMNTTNSSNATDRSSRPINPRQSIRSKD